MKLKINKSKTEEELIAGCLKGDNKAQRELYERFSQKMYAICLRYLKDPDAAEDLMINGFMKVFDRLSQFEGKGSFEGWMRRVMVNEALTCIRQSRNMYVEVEIEKAEREPDYHLLSDHLEADDLMKLINDLPVGYRTIFNLYAIEGYSHREIAEELGISENTSKSQLSRARVVLQNALQKSERIIKEKIISHE